MKIKKLFIAAILLQLFTVAYFAQVEEKPQAVLFDQFKFGNKELLMLKIDGLEIQLQNDPDASSYLLIYGDERARATAKKGILDYIRMKRLNPDRFVVLEGEGGSPAEIELFVVPNGAEPPTPTFREKPQAVAVDQFRFGNKEDLMARLDNLEVQMQNDPSSISYIIVNGNERARANALKEIKDYLKMRRSDLKRYNFLNGNGDKTAEIELWLVQAGAEPPVPKKPIAVVLKDGSVYSDLRPENCKEGDYDKSVPGLYFAVCKGVAGFDLDYYLDDERNSLGIVFPSKKVVGLNFWNYFGEFSELGEKAEWRIKNNKPIALIVRLNISDFDDYEKKTSYLIVSKISDETACVTDIVKPGKNQNVIARQLADKASTKPCKKGRSD